MKFKKSMLLLTATMSLALVMHSCGKKEDPPVTAKTLDKAKLYDKKWYPSPQLIIHEIKSNGTYRSDGTWKWINNSDTMEIVYFEGDAPVRWKFHWSTDNEMSCNLIGAGNATLFKDAPW